MEIFILLFFILLIILLVTSKIEIYINKLEYTHGKIKFFIKINVYTLNKIKILSKKINKKHVIKILEFIIRKKEKESENKNNKKSILKVKRMYIEINYGIKKIYPNIYIYSILNALVPMTLGKYQIRNAQYKINTNFNKNELNIKLKSIIEIDIFKFIINSLKEKIVRILKIKQSTSIL